MDKIRDLFIIKINKDYKSEFEKESCNLGLSHLRILCLAFFILSFYFFYVDGVMYKAIDNTAFRTTSALIHGSGFLISTLFLIFYRKLKNSDNLKLLKIILRCGVVILLLMGSISSISSQRLTGNIDAYILFTIVAAISFPYEPVFMFFSFLVNHVILIVGIIFLSRDYYSLITKQINSTALATISFLFCYALYRHRVIDSVNKYKIAKSEANFKKMFSVNPIPLFLSRYDDGKVVMGNDRAYKFYGYSEEEFYKLFAKDLYKDENDRAYMINNLDKSFKVEDFIVEQKNKQGATKWVIANYELVQHEGENYILTSVTDITEIKKMENELLAHASKDTLTGGLNRRTGLNVLEDKMKESQEKHKPLVICFVDIDNLKFVNDRYGHSEGDFLINAVAEIVRENISSKAVFFRYGGDEFVLLFPEENEESVEKTWGNIKLNFSKLNGEKIKPYKISASHGIFEYNGEVGLTIKEVMDLADKKMYLEKNLHKRLR